MKRKPSPAYRWLHPIHERGYRCPQASIGHETTPLPDAKIDEYVAQGVYLRRAWQRQMARVFARHGRRS